VSTALHRYWIRFDWESMRNDEGSIGVADVAFFDLMGGVGVTAHDVDDAYALIKARVNVNTLLPVADVVEDVDPAALSVAGPMGDASVRGIWYPVTS